MSAGVDIEERRVPLIRDSWTSVAMDHAKREQFDQDFSATTSDGGIPTASSFVARGPQRDLKIGRSLRSTNRSVALRPIGKFPRLHRGARFDGS